MIKYKRELFRTQIRQQFHQNVFKQKRILANTQVQQAYSFNQLIDMIANPRIITQDHLKELNSCLLYCINQKLSNEQIQLIERNVDNLLSLLMYQITNKNTLILESLTIFINLTFFSDEIQDKLLTNSHTNFNILQVISGLISNGTEVRTALELLINVWCNSNSQKLEQLDLIIAINDLTHNSISKNENQNILLISKCLKNFVSCICDDFLLFDCDYLVKLIKTLLNYGLKEKPQFISDQIEIYCIVVQKLNLNFLQQDYDLILNLINLSLGCITLVELITKLLSYFCINETECFYELLQIHVIEYSKQIIRLNNNEVIPSILNLLSIIFYQLSQTFNNLLQPFYDDNVILKEIIRLSEGCYPKKVREASIRCIKILIESSNELQIQNLVDLETHIILIDLLKDFSLDQFSTLFTLQSLNNLLSVFSVQAFQMDYPHHLMQFALSNNQEIADEANQILLKFEDDFHNICQ
ncbi:unnamed protein product (macronuclear) [Paramecium tetraurelia]|uniref:IBB domain-containing protein n=1 Tax=Paramecium tetraurelia TaxID=5888 RepID=A0D0V8_PARTE|nr:uncharacterized protein GSPATT00012227001 [Paramecium tetraurelia]CAK76675.1 unnamed protein product [Paramecium tetraurelia]|eukprot:XP_001444072.1 hypothetical protein (macronuclear) [Paramecium tetraurelia strain d4-2]